MLFSFACVHNMLSVNSVFRWKSFDVDYYATIRWETVWKPMAEVDKGFAQDQCPTKRGGPVTLGS